MDNSQWWTQLGSEWVQLSSMLARTKIICLKTIEIKNDFNRNKSFATAIFRKVPRMIFTNSQWLNQGGIGVQTSPFFQKMAPEIHKRIQ